MANTLKFGNGEWYGKKDTILAYNDLNSNYKPLPFNFSRASKATVINKDGLIETVGSGQPRIDYADDSKGALKLEPSRSNLITYSEDFSDVSWSKTNVTLVSDDGVSPDGTLSADLMYPTATDSNFTYIFDTVNNVNSSQYTISAFVKSSGINVAWLYIQSSVSVGYVYFDLSDESIQIVNGSSNTLTAKINAVGNGWYKISCTNVTPISITSGHGIGISDAKGSRAITKNGTNGMLIYGLQLEEGSYPTSYIPTQGSAVTRLADSCNQTVPDGVIGQTEGTMFLDVDFDTLSDLNMFLSIRPNSSNKIEIYRDGNIIYAETASSNSFNISKTNITVGRYKIAFAYSSGSSAMYINGVLIGSNTDTFAFTSTLEEIYINSRGTSFIEQSNYNDLKLYNTRLTNAELQALTT